MKKGFTLVEMLIVVAVLVSLMGITFRLGSIEGTSSRRSKTIARLQRLENCLSGYYAAFGTYPPVKLHGSRNYKLSVSSRGIQNIDGEEESLNWSWADNRNSQEELNDWRKVEAACKAQPLGCYFPYAEGYGDIISMLSLEMQEMASSMTDEEKKKIFSAGFDDGVSNNRGRYSSYDDVEWREVQLFKFGLMSYLLPRFLVMMNSYEEMYEYRQWTDNNFLPADPLDGRKFPNWKRVREYAIDPDPEDSMHVANIPSQAVCSRWIANLEKSCVCNGVNNKFYGVDIRDGDAEDLSVGNKHIEVFAPGGFEEDSTDGQYVLDRVTINDGWGKEFYYYSPPPYQSYVIWSAGPNLRTFPPWVSRDTLDSKANECVGIWVQDDIASMSN